MVSKGDGGCYMDKDLVRSIDCLVICYDGECKNPTLTM